MAGEKKIRTYIKDRVGRITLKKSSDRKRISPYIEGKIGRFAGKTDASKRSEALNYAYEMRDTLDKEYWTRAAYCWTLLGATFAGYGAVFISKDICEPKQTLVLLVISAVGFLLSWAWYQMSRGSKYWMVHWERKIRSLQNPVTGPLFGGDADDDDSRFWDLWDPYPFSVAKVNCLISLYAWILWGFIGAYTISQAPSITSNCIIWFLVYFTFVGWSFLLFSVVDQHRES